MTLTEENLQTYNGLFVWDINKAYYDIINSDPVRSPYKNRKWWEITWFDKRHWYAKRTFNNGLFFKEWYDITDIVNIWDFLYYLSINKWAWVLEIYRETIATWDLYLITTDSWSAWMAESFVITNFVSGKPKQLYVWDSDVDANIGIQVNDPSTMLWSFKDESVSDWTNTWNYNSWEDSINPWDYIYVYDISTNFVSWVSGIPWTVGRVWSINEDDVTIINVQSLWPNFSATQTEGNKCKYYVFPKIWEVILFATTSWIKCLHYDDIDVSWDVIITDVWQTDKWYSALVEHNWFITYYNQEWWVVSYWWVWTNQLNWFFSQYIPINKNVINMASFSWYLLALSKNNITACTISPTESPTWAAYVWIAQTVMNKEWIWSKNSFDVSELWMFIVTSDKRFWALSLSAPWAYYWNNNIEPKFTPMSEWIQWHLDLLEEWDEVSVSIRNDEIRIYINWDTPESWVLNKTKILIYDMTWKFWRTHISYNAIVKWWKHMSWIPWTIDNLFLWDTCYNYCWRRDSNCRWWEFYYDQEFSWFLWEMTEWSIISIYKKLHYAKLLLWLNCSLHNATTTLQVDKYMYWYKPVYMIDNIESVRYINMINAINDWEDIEPSDCEVSLLEECSNYTNPCEWSWATDDEDACWEDIYKEDYGICIDSNKYFLSPFANIYVPLNLWMFSELFKFTFKATWEDRIHFGWNIIWYESQLPSWINPDWLNSRLCTECLWDVKPCDCEK